MRATKLTLSTAKNLQRLLDGEIIAYSRIKNHFIDELIAENILWKKGKHRQTVQLQNGKALEQYLNNQLQIADLELFIHVLSDEDRQRSDLVVSTTDSKYLSQRTFKGFLVNCYQPIQAQLHGEPYIIEPKPGTFTFIYDYEDFTVESAVTIIGVENAENFRHIEQQQYLFDGIVPLFVSRYPQTQHKDVIRWIEKLENPYWHFGDFDLAGIGIYLHEYKKYLGQRATFFTPTHLEADLAKYGSRARYHNQSMNFTPEDITEPDLDRLLTLIQQQQVGLDQEFYIQNMQRR